jgi:hypothetical protein
MGWVVSTTLRPLYPGNEKVPVVREAGWSSGQIRACAKLLGPHWDSIRGPFKRSQSLCRLSSPGPHISYIVV